MGTENRDGEVVPRKIAVFADPVLWVGVFALIYLAVLPMANTIALRNVALFCLLISLALHFREIRKHYSLGTPVLLWAAYLVVFPLIADNHLVAWHNLGGQWGRNLLALLAGAGVAAALINSSRGRAFYLGLATAVPILVHLYLFAKMALQSGTMPVGYWGRETHHADLGYAAGQAVILLSACAIAGARKHRVWAISLALAAVLSTLLARSRAGFAFAIFGGILVFLVAYFSGTSRIKHYIPAGLLGVVVLGGLLMAFAVKDDSRWRNMAAQMSAGLLGDPIQIECEGTASIEPAIVAKHGAGDESQRIIAAIRDGDGTRIVVLRAGVQLAMAHPWGSDGSRQAFKKRIMEICPTPAIPTAHAHNGWIDTLLAIGWMGGLLYLAVLLYFLFTGIKFLRTNHVTSEWGLVLVALSIFWIVRGFTDSVFRDHMLEMQGFVLAYAAVAISRIRDAQADRSSEPIFSKKE